MTVDFRAPPFGIAHPDKLFIGGKWVKPSSDKTLPIISPSTEELVGYVPEAQPRDIEAAVAAARKAFDHGPWPRLSIEERAGYLKKLGDLLMARVDALTHIWTTEAGVPQVVSRRTCQGTAYLINYYIDLVRNYPFEEVRPRSTGVGVVVREPVGVVAAVVPWNAPLFLAMVKLVPALLAGCTIVVKPAPETPLDTYILAECIAAANFPEGVVSIVAAGREASDHLIRHSGIDKVTFTGSTATGKHIAGVCAERLARVCLELGGKSAALILDDADPATVIPEIASQVSGNAGQVCITLSRVLVPRKKHDDYAAAFAEAFRKIKIGDPFDPSTELGTLAMKRQFERVEGYVAKGRAEGAKLVTGGGRPEHLNRGYFFAPTLFANADNSMTIAREEIFGPVLSMIPYDTVDEAVAIANDSSYGLHGAVFTPDPDRAYQLARRIRTGNVGHNSRPLELTLPFGGFKQSGIGREGGPEGLGGFLEIKTVYMNQAPAPGR